MQALFDIPAVAESIQLEQIPNSILIRNHELALSFDRAPGTISLPSLVATREAI